MVDPDDDRGAGEVEAPGWAAIDRALSRRYPGQLPHQFASKTAYELESQSPLPAIAAYEGEGPPHWHFVTYGLSELFEKTSPDPDLSGFGFELTLRTPRSAGEAHPPAWPLRFLQALGGHVLATGAPLDTGHRVDLGGPLAPGHGALLRALALVPDPTLGKIDAPFGSLLFLQVVGLSAAELEGMRRLAPEKVVMLLAELDPLGLTDPTRGCWTTDERKAPALRRYQLGIEL